MATTLDDAGLRTVAHHNVALNYFHLGEYHAANRLFTRNVEGPDAEPAKSRHGEFSSPYLLGCGCLAWSLAVLGEFESALAAGNRALEAAEVAGHPAGHAFALNYAALARFYRGDYPEAVRLCERAVQLCEAHGLLVFVPIAYTTWGRILASTGRTAEGLEYLKRAKDLWEAMGLKVAYCRFYLNLAEGLLLAGNHGEARPAAETALELATGASERGDEAEVLWILGEIAATSSAEAGCAYYHRATAVAETLGMRPLVAHCHLGLGKLYRRTGEQEKAHEHLTTATTMYREMGMTYWLEKAEAEMRELK